jgi:hypothetical protein
MSFLTATSESFKKSGSSKRLGTEAEAETAPAVKHTKNSGKGSVPALPKASEAKASARGADSASASVPAAKPAAKARAKTSGKATSGITEENLLSVVSDIAELTLVNSRDVAMLRSILVDVCLFYSNEETLWLEKGYKAVTTTYQENLVNMSPEEKANSSSVHIFIWLECITNGVAAVLPEVMQHKAAIDKEVTEEIEKLHTAHTMNLDMKDAVWTPPLAGSDQLNKIVRTILERQVKVFRKMSCHKAKQWRLEAQATETAKPAVDAIMRLLVEKGEGEMRYQQAPRGKLERKIGKALGRR